VNQRGDIMPRDIHIDKILDLYTIVETKMKNRKNWGKTVVLNVHNEFLEVAQIEEYVSDALMAGDPLECRVVTNDCIILMDTVVYNIKLVSSSIVLKIINVQKLDNVRKHKRYEVNLSGSFHKSDDMHEKYIIVIQEGYHLWQSFAMAQPEQQAPHELL